MLSQRKKAGATRPLILGIGGTTRTDSSSEKALATTLQIARDAGADTISITGPDLILPMYNPSDTKRTQKSRALVDAFRRCDGLVICSPSYHGSISGLVKNALDYVEDLRTEGRVYLDGVPVGLIACAGGWQAAGQTLATLRGIAHALRAWPTPMGATLNTSLDLFDQDRQCIDTQSAFQLTAVGNQVVEFAKVWMDAKRAPDKLRA